MWQLPPLILHPFGQQHSPAALVEGHRAAVLLAQGDESEELLDKVTAGRLTEIGMLFFLGKDLFRWMDQCTEHCARHVELARHALRAQNFAALLMEAAPPAVQSKLACWGVADYRAIFSRAIAIRAVFCEASALAHLTPEFVRGYPRYCERILRCWWEAAQPPQPPEAFAFQLYASHEYSALLDLQWNG